MLARIMAELLHKVRLRILGWQENTNSYRTRYSRKDSWEKWVLSKREGIRQQHFNSFLSASCSNTQDIATANSVPRIESNFATITFTESITESICTLKSNQQVCCIEVVIGHYPSHLRSILTKNIHLNRRTSVNWFRRTTLFARTKDALNQTSTFSDLLIENDSFGQFSSFRDFVCQMFEEIEVATILRVVPSLVPAFNDHVRREDGISLDRFSGETRPVSGYCRAKRRMWRGYVSWHWALPSIRDFYLICRAMWKRTRHSTQNSTSKRMMWDKSLVRLCGTLDS